LAAMLVERVAGMSLPQFTRTRFFGPLGMTSTSWRDDYGRIVKHRATAYTGVSNVGFRQDMPFENVYGNSSLLTTVADLLRWNEFLGKDAPAALRQLMHERGLLNNGDTLTYALGIEVEQYRGVREVNHTGATAGYRAYLGRFPDQRLGVALLCNSGRVNPGAIGHQVANIFLGNALKPLVLPTTPAAPPAGLVRVRTANGDTVVAQGDASWKPSTAELGQYIGRYTSDEAESALTFSVQDGALVATERYGTSARLTPVYRDAFTRGGQLFRFRRDASGTITAVSLGLGRVRDLRFAKSAAP
ncbi:MAG TPA: serine hydrolase domain-containing protein, partial [Gemmatimonadaceae bacterium]|nr:serine hydrolase domain-containing protein [Gemmatimonadaceae bacterium]